MRHAHAYALAAALLAGCGQPLLSMRVEVPELRLTTPSQTFPAPFTVAPPQALCDGATQGCVFTDLGYDLAAELPVVDEEGVTIDLRLTDVTFRFVSSSPGGPSDLSAILEARVLVRDPATGGSTVVASYAKPAGATPTTIEISGASNIDLGPYLTSGALDARVEFDYDAGAPAPPATITVDVEAGFSLVVTANYSAFL